MQRLFLLCALLGVSSAFLLGGSGCGCAPPPPPRPCGCSGGFPPLPALPPLQLPNLLPGGCGCAAPPPPPPCGCGGGLALPHLPQIQFPQFQLPSLPQPCGTPAGCGAPAYPRPVPSAYVQAPPAFNPAPVNSYAAGPPGVPLPSHSGYPVAGK